MLDNRSHIINLIKTIPLDLIITYIYPKLYGVHNLTEKVTTTSHATNIVIMQYFFNNALMCSNHLRNHA